MIGPPHIWNFIYNALSNKSHPPTSPNIAPATENHSHILPHIKNVIYNARSNKSHPPTSPNTAPATENHSHDWSSSHMKRHLQCAEQQEPPSNFTNGKSLSWLKPLTYETSFTMRRATRATLQLHQIVLLPRKITLMIEAPHIWNVIYNAREQVKSPSILTKYCTCHEILSSRFEPKNPWIASANIKTIPPWSDHEIVISHPPLRRPYSSHLGDAFCMEKYNISGSGYLSKFHEVLCLPRKITLQLHQMLRLPRKITLMIEAPHIWNVIYNARSK